MEWEGIPSKRIKSRSDKQVKEIKLLFSCLDEEDSDYGRIVEDIGMETLSEVQGNIRLVQKEDSVKLENTVKKDKPIKPDWARKLNVYTSKYQFVELKFPGANLHLKKVKLPPNTLPLHDQVLRDTIEANLRILENIPEKEFLEPFFALKVDIEIHRKDFFYYLNSRNKSIIKREEKFRFEQGLKEFAINLEEIKDSIQNDLQKEIGKARKRVKKNLIEFYKDNPPNELDGLTGDILIDEVEDFVGKLMTKIHFPRANTLLKVLDLKWNYYDITWEDLNDKEVISEMLKFGFIKEQDKLYFEEQAIAANEIM